MKKLNQYINERLVISKKLKQFNQSLCIDFHQLEKKYNLKITSKSDKDYTQISLTNIDFDLMSNIISLTSQKVKQLVNDIQNDIVFPDNMKLVGYRLSTFITLSVQNMNGNKLELAKISFGFDFHNNPHIIIFSYDKDEPQLEMISSQICDYILNKFMQ